MTNIINGRGRVGVRPPSGGNNGGGGGNSYGTLTTAWITATGESDVTILNALNTLENDLNTYGLTSKMKALYPFVGGTATKHSFNFVNTTQFQLAFNGGWTHSSTGALPNGTNAYANTGFKPSTQLTTTSGNIGIYSRTDKYEFTTDFGASTGSVYIYLGTNIYGTVGYASYASEFGFASTDTRGLYSLGRLSSQSSNVRLIRNGSTIIYDNNPGPMALPNVDLYLSAFNNNGSAQWFSSRELALSYMSDGLTNSEIANLYTAVQAFQTTLGRQV